MTWTATLHRDGEPVATVPAHIADVASLAAPMIVTLFGGPVSVGAAIVAHQAAQPAEHLTHPAPSVVNRCKPSADDGPVTISTRAGLRGPHQRQPQPGRAPTGFR